MNRAILSIIVLGLAACSKEAPPATETNNAVEVNAAAEAPAAVPSLVGTWTVTQINGRAPDQVWPMTARISADTFVLTSECRKMGYGFHQDRNIVHLTPNAAVSVNCGRVKSPAEQIIEKPLSLANIAMFSGEDKVEFSGPGGRIAMTRQ